MANARINRKGFLKGLGVAAAACVARPASAVASAVASQVESANSQGAITALELPRKTLAASRIVAYRPTSV
jgi:hypothetical protein